MKRLGKLFLCFTLLFLLLGQHRGQAQASPTASGPGSYVAVGGGISWFQADYGRQELGGGLLYAEVNPHWRFGLEGEARFLRLHSQQDVTEANYLGGVRVALLRPRRLQPYAKFLAGVGKITLPYGYAHGSFLAYAPGAGLDVALGDRLTLRAVDLEYGRWPGFAFGPLSPYGVSAGLLLRLNPVHRYPGTPR